MEQASSGWPGFSQDLVLSLAGQQDVQGTSPDAGTAYICPSSASTHLATISAGHSPAAVDG